MIVIKQFLYIKKIQDIFIKNDKLKFNLFLLHCEIVQSFQTYPGIPKIVLQ